MKKMNFLLVCCAMLTTSLFAQICPKNYEITLKTTYETLNNADGELEVSSFTGGTSPYTYAWSNGGSSSTISNLSSGNYRLTVSDANSCFYTMCAFVDKDSLPCQSSLLFDPCGDTIAINYQFWASKRPLQTGLLVELYDESNILLKKQYVSTYTGTGFYFFLTNDLYYNNTYQLVLKGIFGSDTSDFCGDTCSFTIEDFRCNTWVNNSCQPVIDINNMFWVSKYQHMTGVQIALFDAQDSLLNTYVQTNSTGGGFYFALGPQIYYLDTFKVITRGIYQPGDTSSYCTDTCEFVVDSFPDSYAFLASTCQDTVVESHLFIVNSHRHKSAMLFEVYSDDTFSVLDTVYSSTQVVSSGYGTNLKNRVDPEDDYCIIARGIFQNPYYPSAPADTALVGDTCCFYLKANPELSRGGGSFLDKQVKSRFSEEILISPNPTKERIRLSNIPSTSKGSSLKVRVFDVKGTLVKEEQGGFTQSFEFGVAELPVGQYHIQVFDGDDLLNINKLSFIKE